MAREKAPLPNAGPADDKKRAIDTAMAQIERMYGKGSIMRFGDKAELNVDYIPTGSLALDVALGIGGLPKGRIVEIYGPESSGKTTLALHVMAEAQKRGGEVAFVDAEHALDPTYARALGVKVEDMLIAQPDTGEQALEITEALVRSGAIDVVVVDSVAALVPRAEIEGEMGDSYVGLQARLMSQALRKLTGAIGKTNCIVIFINQLREKVGIMYGNPEVTTGGRALKFYASVRIDVRRIEALKNGCEIDRQPDPGQGGEEQGGAPLPGGGVRHHVRRGHLPLGRAHRPGREAGSGAEVRLLVLHGGDPHRPGPGRRQAVPAGEPGGGGQAGGGHPQELRQADEQPGPHRRQGGGPGGGRERRRLRRCGLSASRRLPTKRAGCWCFWRTAPA